MNTEQKKLFRVSYAGILQGTISRDFETLERAIQWARQVGVYEYASIFELMPDEVLRLTCKHPSWANDHCVYCGVRLLPE